VKQTLNAPLSSIFPDLPHWATVPAPILKDLRVVAVPAFWGIALLVLGTLFFRHPLGILGSTVDGIACSAIAALMAGQDFFYRTTSWSMALPVSRGRVWGQRIAIAGLAMLPVLVTAFVMDWFPLVYGTQFHANSTGWLRLVHLYLEPAITALCLAPWLTLLSRSALFGVVFSTGAMVLSFIFTSSLFEIIGISHPQEAAATFTQYAMPCIWIFGAVMGWRKFMTLEVIEPGAKTAKLTRTATTQRVRRTSATWQLFKKEIMLQRFPIALAAIAMGLAFVLKKEQTALWTLVYPAAIVIVIASVSCAEERQLGIAEWQVLLPVAFWRQWVMKFFVTYSLAAIVGVALPLILLRYKTNELRNLEGVDLLPLVTVFGASLLMFVVITMYVSSLCSSGIKAVMAATWVNVLAAYLIGQSFEAYVTFLWKQEYMTETWSAHDGVVRHTKTFFTPEGGDWWLDAHYLPFLISVIGLVALAMIFAMRNHQSAERGRARVLRQLFVFAVYQAVVMLSVFSFWNWYSWLH
jgi:hypothetical protein